MLSDLVFRLRALLRRHVVEQELDQELRLHLEHEAAKYMRAGVDREEAHRRARVALGGIEPVKEHCRDARGTRLVEDVRQDLRYAARMLWRTPGFALVAILSLALGIGANVAVFTVVCGELFPKLAYREAERLVKLVGVVQDGAAPTRLSDAEVLAVLDVASEPPPRDPLPRDSLSGDPLTGDPLAGDPVARGIVAGGRAPAGTPRLFDEVASVSGRAFHLTDGASEPERLVGAGVSTNFLSLLGVAPLIGRDFRPEDAQPAADSVVILKESLWRNRYGRSPDVLGRRITLNGQSHVVIGVVASDPWLRSDAGAIYVPAALDASGSRHARDNYDWDVYARLRPGLALAAGQAAMEAAAPRWAAVNSDTHRHRRLRAVPLAQTVFVDREENRASLLLLQTAVGFVLLIACANVGSLLLARATARRHELALRAALGAGRARLLRQLLTESLLLAGLAGITGWCLSWLGARLLANLWGWHQAAVDDGRGLAFTAAFTGAVGLATAMLCGIAPVRQMLQAGDERGLSEQGRGASAGRRSRRVLDALVVSEIALALGLLVGAGVLLRGLAVRLESRPGFVTTNLLLARTHFLGPRYAAPAARAQFIERAVAAIAAVPGVRAAAVVDPYPPAGEARLPIVAAGSQLFTDAEPQVRHRAATHGYLRTLGVKVRRGRDFEPRDERAEPGKAIINAEMARRFWPGADPIGASITTRRGRQLVSLEVIGVVATGDNNLAYHPAPRPEVIELSPVPSEAPWFMVRTDGDPMPLLPGVRRAVLTVDPAQPVAAIRTVDGWIAQESAPHRSLASVLGLFAGVALALVAMGVYGTLSYVASLRRREAGVRIALGARPLAIVQLFLTRSVGLLLVAWPLGLAASWAITRWMSTLLFGVGFAEPAILLLTGGLLCVTVLLSAFWPAWRCARMDPVSVLRAE